jgi:hypothetical protein
MLLPWHSPHRAFKLSCWGGLSGGQPGKAVSLMWHAAYMHRLRPIPPHDVGNVRFIVCVYA